MKYESDVHIIFDGEHFHNNRLSPQVIADTSIHLNSSRSKHVTMNKAWLLTCIDGATDGADAYPLNNTIMPPHNHISTRVWRLTQEDARCSRTMGGD